MKVFLLLALAAFASGDVSPVKVVENADFPSINEELPSVLGYLVDVAIPLAKARKAAEEAYFAKQRIAGGSPAIRGQYPWQAGLLSDIVGIDNANGVCGASLVSSNRLITAAHCWFDGINQGWRFTVVLGSVFLYGVDGMRIQTSNVVLHPQWLMQLIRNDVAVIYLPFNVPFSSYIAPVALPSGAELQEDFVGSTVIISGFGLRGDSGPEADITANQFLSHTTSTVITNAVCRRTFLFLVSDSNICIAGKCFSQTNIDNQFLSHTTSTVITNAVCRRTFLFLVSDSNICIAGKCFIQTNIDNQFLSHTTSTVITNAVCRRTFLFLVSDSNICIAEADITANQFLSHTTSTVITNAVCRRTFLFLVSDSNICIAGKCFIQTNIDNQFLSHTTSTVITNAVCRRTFLFLVSDSNICIAGKCFVQTNIDNQFLSHTTSTVITNAVCRRTFLFLVSDSNICIAGDGGRSTCKGDSGGPMVVYRNGRPILIGVTSFGSPLGCARDRPAGFARVTSFMDFFRQHIN
ncbi:trypsin domain-containing protein [Phthorimaea operculella]|nr:trypsin domain-containing protein [Phthorimaea operculella]